MRLVGPFLELIGLARNAAATAATQKKKKATLRHFYNINAWASESLLAVSIQTAISSADKCAEQAQKAQNTPGLSCVMGIIGTHQTN